MAPSTQGPHIFDDSTRLPPKPSVIRAILSAKSHKRNLSADEAFAPQSPFHRSKPSDSSIESSIDGQYQHQSPLTERAANRDAGDGAPKSPTKSEKVGLHKKTKSAVSLKSLKNYMERKDSNKSEDLPDDEESSMWKPKKTKSATSLTAILKRSQRGRKGDESSKESGNKENRSPLDLPDLPSPVWTPYSARSLQEQPGQPRAQDRRRTIQDEVSLYTPKGYSPAQQRNFYDYHQPSLTKRTDAKPRPKSDILFANRKVKEVLGIMQPDSLENASSVEPSEPPSPSKGRPRRFSRPRSKSEIEQQPEQKPEPSPKKSSRVQAAISAFNAKEQEADLHRRLNSKDLESEFEKLLVSQLLTFDIDFGHSANCNLGRKKHPRQHEGQNEVLGYQHQSRLHSERP